MALSKKDKARAENYRERRKDNRKAARKFGNIATDYFNDNARGRLNNGFWINNGNLSDPSELSGQFDPENILGRLSDKVMGKYDALAKRSGRPGVQQPDKSFFTDIRDNISGYQDQISDFVSNYEDNYNTFTDFTTDIGNRATFLSEDAADYDFNDTGLLDDQITDLRRDVRTFDNPFDLGGQYGFGQYGSTFHDAFGGLPNRLDELQSQRQAEQDRISGSRSDLRNTADNLRGAIRQMDITDANQFDPLSYQIEDRVREANRFESDLDFDFGDETRDLTGLSNQIDDLRRRRAQEEGRIGDATQSFNTQSDRLGSLVENLGTRNLDRLNNARDSISEFRNTVGGFSSKLDPDFSSAVTRANDAEATVQGLLDTRQGELDTLGSNIADVRAGISDVPLHDEDAFADRRSQLRGLQADLNRYSGGRVEDIGGQVDTAIGDIDTRLQELADKRADIEQRTQAAYEALQDQSFTNLDALDDPFAQRDTLQEEMDLYNADQALDELSQMERFLNTERNRLQQDRENVLARERIGQEEIEGAMGPNGRLTFDNFREIQPLTEEQFARLVSEAEDEEDQGQDFATAFSRALGLTRR